jgi:5-methylcytosine-specific restriction endonuclease McrA
MSDSPWRDARTGRRRGSTRAEQKLRLQVFWRDKAQCQLCHRPVDMRLRWPHPLSATVHHLVPFKTHDLRHLVLAHKSCNEKAGSPGLLDPAPKPITRW